MSDKKPKAGKVAEHNKHRKSSGPNKLPRSGVRPTLLPTD